MRVTGGRFLGRRLSRPRGSRVRPTPERVREALFGRLGSLEGQTVLDLYAGSGMLGIEALSRGALRVVFVERSGRALAVLRRNLESLGLGAEAEAVRGDVPAVVRRLARAGERFDLVLLDPPYETGELQIALEAVASAGILSSGATVVAEHSRRDAPGRVRALAALDERRYGDTTITRFTARSEDKEEVEAMPPAKHSRRTGLFAASFDPVTNGHLDLVRRARSVFDELVVAVGRNVAKEGTFDADERLEMLQAVLGSEEGIRVTSFDGLIADYARQLGVSAVVRGLRAMSDFEYEFEMALMNKHLYPDLETLFMMTDQKYFYVSSSRLKELVRLGGNIEEFVPGLVAKKLQEKLGGR